MSVEKSVSAEDVVRPRHPYARVGELWRRQGKAFLDTQAEILIADVDRLRESFVARYVVEKPLPATATRTRHAPSVIDLRDGAVGDVACSRDGHGNVVAAARCVRCRYVFCAHCIVRPPVMDGAPVCTGCALVLSGVRHKKSRPLVAPGRSGPRVRH